MQNQTSNLLWLEEWRKQSDELADWFIGFAKIDFAYNSVRLCSGRFANSYTKYIGQNWSNAM